MHILGKNNNQKYFKDKEIQKNILNENKLEVQITKEKQDVQIFCDLLKKFHNESVIVSKNTKSLETYVDAFGNYSLSSATSVDVFTQLANLGLTATEGVRGVGLIFLAGIDAKKTISIHNELQNIKKSNKNLHWSLKSFAKRKQVLKLSNKVKRDLKEFIDGEFDVDALRKYYNDALENIINSKDISKSKFFENLNNVVFIKQFIDNFQFRDLGLKYDFLKSIKKDFKKGIELYEIDHPKVPDAIKKIKEDIHSLRNEKRRLGHGEGAEIKYLEKAIYRLQMIEIHSVLERLEKVKNKNEKANMVINGLKTIGDSLGFAGIVGLMSVPPSAPITLPLFGTGVAIRASSVLIQFVKENIDSRKNKQTHKNISELEKNIKNSSKVIISQFFEPLIPEKYPETFKIFKNAMGVIEKNDEISNKSRQYIDEDFYNTFQERVLLKFDEDLNEQLSKNSKLSSEWIDLEQEWYSQKTEINKSQNQRELRDFSKRSINEITNFLMGKICNLKEVENSPNLNDAIDSLIEAKNISNILTLIGINKNGFKPSTFIRRSIEAHQKTEEAMQRNADNMTSEINSSAMLLELSKKMNSLLKTGKTEEESATYLAHEMEKAINKKMMEAQKNIGENIGTEEIILLKDKLRRSIGVFIQN
jgi:hypothetical protein